VALAWVGERNEGVEMEFLLKFGRFGYINIKKENIGK